MALIFFWEEQLVANRHAAEIITKYIFRFTVDFFAGHFVTSRIFQVYAMS
jgi:hypothetical protein